MRVLLIKTSSMGDLIHTLPALTDAGLAHPSITFDWVVEDNFAEIPALHPFVRKVIPVALRRWRKKLSSTKTTQEWREVKRELKQEKYDLILDAQGLVKSAFLMFFTNGRRAGLDWSSARESLASLMYQDKYTVNFYQHAIIRMRSLFSLALGYALPNREPDFGVTRERFKSDHHEHPYVVFLHGTTWESKLWPEEYWIKLARLVNAAGLKVKISGGNDQELQKAKRIQAACKGVDVHSLLSITEMASLMAEAVGVVSVDTGFGHFAAGLGAPTVSLYGSTDPKFTGAIGPRSIQLRALHPCAPCLKRKCHYKGPTLVYPACFASLPPTHVWDTLKSLIL